MHEIAPLGPGRAARSPRPVELVLIGVSTGGPKALMELVPGLGADLPCPVLVVQHMSAGFTAALADGLDRVSKLTVREAAEGDALEPGRVLIAPGGVHMELASGSPPTLHLSDAPPVHGCRPAVDVLWGSVATHFHGQMLGIVLTGMGRDGCDGMRALRRRGAYCIAQDRASSIVWGMPGAVVESGLADEVLPLHSIAARVEALAARGRRLRATRAGPARP